MARAVAQPANQTPRVFLAALSHGLRTPLNAILGDSERLTEDARDEGSDAPTPHPGKI